MENKIILRLNLIVESKIKRMIQKWNFESQKQAQVIEQILKEIYRFDPDVFGQAKQIANTNGYIHPINVTDKNQEDFLDWLIERNNSKQLSLLKSFRSKDKLNLFVKIYWKIYSSIVIDIYLKILFKQRLKATKNVLGNIDQVIQIQSILKNTNTINNPLWNLSPSQLYSLDKNFVSSITKLIKKHSFVENVANVLGKSATAQKTYEKNEINKMIDIPGKKTKFYSPSNMQGITVGNEISNVLPHILSFRNNEKLNRLFKKQFIEKQLMQFDKHDFTNEKKEISQKDNLPQKIKGPFIMVIDTSGSMEGKPEDVAKAMALSIMNVVSKENRKCFIISFSTQVELFDAGDIRNNWKQFYNFLSKSFHGGTDIDIALVESIKIATQPEFALADILFISDMQIGKLNPKIEQDVNLLKQKGTKFYSLTIDNSFSAENISFLDRNWVYDGSQESIDKIVFDLNTINKHYN